jgi:hypothetical protein
MSRSRQLRTVSAVLRTRGSPNKTGLDGNAIAKAQGRCLVPMENPCVVVGTHDCGRQPASEPPRKRPSSVKRASSTSPSTSSIISHSTITRKNPNSQHHMDPFHTAPANDTTFWPRFQQEEDQFEATVWSELTGSAPPVHMFSSALGSPVTVSTNALVCKCLFSSPPQGNDRGAPPTFEYAPSGGTTPTSLMDPVSSRCPVIDQRYWPIATYRRSHSSLRLGLVFIQPKAFTEVGPIAPPQSNTSWASLGPSPTQPVPEPHFVSTSH